MSYVITIVCIQTAKNKNISFQYGDFCSIAIRYCQKTYWPSITAFWKRNQKGSQLITPFSRQETQFQESDTKDKGHDQQKPQVRSETWKCPFEKCICLQFANRLSLGLDAIFHGCFRLLEQPGRPKVFLDLGDPLSHHSYCSVSGTICHQYEIHLTLQQLFGSSKLPHALKLKS